MFRVANEQDVDISSKQCEEKNYRNIALSQAQPKSPQPMAALKGNVEKKSGKPVHILEMHAFKSLFIMPEAYGNVKEA